MGAIITNPRGGGSLGDHTHSDVGDGGSTVNAILVTGRTIVSCGESSVTGGTLRFWDGASAFRHSLGVPVAGYTADRAILLPNINGDIFVSGNAADPATIAGTMSRVNRTAQVASLGTVTPIILCKTCPAGLYMVNVYMECAATGAAGSTVVLTLNYTDSVGAKTVTTTLDTTATTNKQNQTFPIYIDAVGDITWKAVRTGGTFALRMRPAYMGG